MKYLLASFLLGTAVSAAAETCKYVDKDGRVTYSNVPIKTAKKLQCFEPPPVPPPAAKPDRPVPSASGERSGPKVDQQTQRKRDVDRRQILEQELAAEEAQLVEAKKALAEQEAIRLGDERNYQRTLDRLRPYQEAVAQHEKNVASIKQELANVH
jgi:hypothetical protein